MSKALGLKLEVDANILPRDESIGAKIIILVPQTCKTVLDVKKYVAECVLKTTIPINLYLGDYILRDEEDVLVFSCFTDPCRVIRNCRMTTHSPLHQKSITPSPTMPSKLVKPQILSNKSTMVFPNHGDHGNIAKRVKFNDTPVNVVTSSPLPNSSTRGESANPRGFDQIDESNIRYSVDDSILGVQQTPVKTTAKEDVESEVSNEFNKGMLCDESVVLFNGPGTRKKKRKRRHKKRNIPLNSDDDSLNEPDAQSTLATAADKKDIGKKTVLNGNGNCNANSNGASFFADNETDSANETLPFKKPLIQPRSILRKNNTQLRRFEEDDFNTNEILLPPHNVVSSSNLPSTPVSKRLKIRHDTPNLPRVLKNPGIFEMAQQNLGSQLRAVDFKSSIAEGCEDLNTPSPIQNKKQLSIKEMQSTQNKKDIEVTDAEREENYYSSLPSVTDINTVNVGDIIAFKVIEMDEKYCPTVSPYKEAVVVSKTGFDLSLNYTRKKAIERTGIFEIDDEDFIGDQIDDTTKNFSTDLMCVKMVKVAEVPA